MNKPIDETMIDYDKWHIYKLSDTSYEYHHFQDSFCGEDQQYKIIITWKNDLYNFDAQEYCEIYGSGGWSRWTDYEDIVKKTVLDDAMERMKIEEAEKTIT